MRIPPSGRYQHCRLSRRQLIAGAAAAVGAATAGLKSAEAGAPTPINPLNLITTDRDNNTRYVSVGSNRYRFAVDRTPLAPPG